MNSKVNAEVAALIARLFPNAEVSFYVGRWFGSVPEGSDLYCVVTLAPGCTIGIFYRLHASRGEYLYRVDTIAATERTPSYLDAESLSQLEARLKEACGFIETVFERAKMAVDLARGIVR